MKIEDIEMTKPDQQTDTNPNNQEKKILNNIDDEIERIIDTDIIEEYGLSVIKESILSFRRMIINMKFRHSSFKKLSRKTQFTNCFEFKILTKVSIKFPDKDDPQFFSEVYTISDIKMMFKDKEELKRVIEIYESKVIYFDEYGSDDSEFLYTMVGIILFKFENDMIKRKDYCQCFDLNSRTKAIEFLQTYWEDNFNIRRQIDNYCKCKCLDIELIKMKKFPNQKSMLKELGIKTKFMSDIEMIKMKDDIKKKIHIANLKRIKNLIPGRKKKKNNGFKL